VLEDLQILKTMVVEADRFRRLDLTHTTQVRAGVSFPYEMGRAGVFHPWKFLQFYES
jgi:hypothetical protein